MPTWRRCARSSRRRVSWARRARWPNWGWRTEAAAGDMAELRVLLRAWRDAKRSALKAAIAWVLNLVLALVLVGMAVKLGFEGFR